MIGSLRFRPQYLLYVAAAALLVWVLSTAPLRETLAVLSSLSIDEVWILVALNGGILMALTARWWCIVRAQGASAPIVHLLRIRLAAYGISYFTPGPQFGGEPVQVYLLGRRHGVARTTATASVLLDKVLELLTNFIFLALGLLVLLQWRIFAGLNGTRAVVIVSGIVLLLLVYMVALGFAKRPLTGMLQLVPVPHRLVPLAVRSLSHTLYTTIAAGEAEAAALCRRRPYAIAQASAVSAAALVMMVFEYWLMVRFLGVHLSPVQAIITLTAARVAFLLPLPGGIGALEASQVLVFSALGFNPAVGISISLLIRARDVALAMAGLWWGTGKSSPEQVPVSMPNVDGVA